MCESIQNEHHCSKNTTASGSNRCQWVNPDGAKANCNDMTSLVPALVADVQTWSGQLVTPLNNTINFKIIFKTAETAPYIMKVKDLISWSGTGTEAFCGPKQL